MTGKSNQVLTADSKPCIGLLYTSTLGYLFTHLSSKSLCIFKAQNEAVKNYKPVQTTLFLSSSDLRTVPGSRTEEASSDGGGTE